MIAKKPKKTEEEFLRGARGSNGAVAAMRPRLPEDLYRRLKKLAWKRRITANALIVELLEAAISRKRPEGSSRQ